MKDTLAYTYHGIVVSYSRGENKWVTEIRGRERKFNSVMDAEAAIDATPPKDKKPFNRIKAYIVRYGTVELADVTSIAENTRYGIYFWTVGKDNRREKVCGDNLFPVNDYNTRIVDSIVKLKQEESNLRAKIEKLNKDLHALKLDPDIESPDDK